MSKTQAERERKRREWRGHLQRQEASGRTIVEYAKAVGVSVDALYYWRRRFRREAQEKDTPVTLLPVRLAGEAAPASMRLHLRNGVVVEWSPALDAVRLAEVLRLAGALP